MRIAVCDDESGVREEVVRLIRTQQPEAEVAAFAAPAEMLADGRDFSIVFLDIAMDAQADGIALARAIRLRQAREKSVRSILIFITGYSAHMQEAFDVNAFHYLLKPLDAEKFRRVFRRAWAEAAQLEARAARSIMVKAAGMQRKIPVRDVLYAESANKRVWIHSFGGSLEAHARMDDLERALGSAFFRSHRCYLVNMEHIAAYSVDTIELVNGARLLLAKKKYPAFVKAFLRYAREGGAVHV